MFNFEFVYKDKSKLCAENIVKVTYINFDDVVVENEEILTHAFPVSCDLHLYSEERNYTISSNGLVSINISRAKA